MTCRSSTVTSSCPISASSTKTEDGRLEHRDVELVTEHYSRGQLAGKARAGFALLSRRRSRRRQRPRRHAVRSAPPGATVMTFDERVRALEPLGFSEPQTRFLVTVALHSGFCLRRHYTAFAGLQVRRGRARLPRPTGRATPGDGAPTSGATAATCTTCMHCRDLRRHRPGRQPEPAAHQPGADRAQADAARLRARPSEPPTGSPPSRTRSRCSRPDSASPLSDLPQRVYLARRARQRGRPPATSSTSCRSADRASRPSCRSSSSSPTRPGRPSSSSCRTTCRS